MQPMTLEQVEKALSEVLGAPVVKYNRAQDSYILMNIFFKALGRIGPGTLLEKIRQQLPRARILKTWTNSGTGESHCGYECVEFRLEPISSSESQVLLQA
jgi:hypothetical protein